MLAVRGPDLDLINCDCWRCAGRWFLRRDRRAFGLCRFLCVRLCAVCPECPIRPRCISCVKSTNSLAGELGFEPRFSESESDVLPLNYSPTRAAADVVAGLPPCGRQPG